MADSLARTVMGGLLSSVFLTLLVLPYISVLVEALADWMRRLWRASGRVVGTQTAPSDAATAASGT